MSLDKSLKSKNSLERHRNVLTRAERIAVMQESGHWNDDSKPTGLPKIVHRKAAVGKKDKAEKKTDEDAAEKDTDAAAST